MNNQEIFDKVARHLLIQGVKSISIAFDEGAGDCKYRGPNGTMCAIGCLIPDAEYLESMEGFNIAGVSSISRTIRNLDHMFLASLQRIHDNYSPEEWKARLNTLASEVNLDAPVLEEFQ